MAAPYNTNKYISNPDKDDTHWKFILFLPGLFGIFRTIMLLLFFKEETPFY